MIQRPHVALAALLAAAGGSHSMAQTAPDASIALPGIDISVPRQDAVRGPAPGFTATRADSATKTGTPRIETPQSISVITRDQIDAQNAQSVTQALRYSANVNAERFGADPRSEFFSIRGFAADTYLDGLRIPQIANQSGSYAGYRIEPYSLERIEIVRGPASVLFGQGNLGGVVNLVSKDPSATASREFGVQLGNFARKQGVFDLTGPLTQDGSVLYRLNGLVRDSHTQTSRGRDDRIALNPSLTWRPTADTQVTLYGGYLHDSVGQPGAILPANGALFGIPSGRIERKFNDGQPGFDKYVKNEEYVGYRLEHRFNDVFSLRQNVRYTHLDLDYRGVFGAGLQANQRTLNRIAINSQPVLNAIAADTQLQARVSTGPLSHTVLAGVDQQWQHFQNRIGQAAAPTLDLVLPNYTRTIALPPITTNANQTQLQTGVYLQDQIALGGFRLVLSGREDFTSLETRNNTTGRTVSQSPNQFTGRVGLLYLFDAGFAPYVSYATSFLPLSGTNLAGDPYRPQKGELVEVGIKYQPPGLRSFVALTAFDQSQTNVVTTSPTNPRDTVQTGEVRVKGIELEATVSLSDRFNLIASASYQEPEVTKSNGADLGKRPFTVPTRQAGVFADYTIEFSDRARLTLGGGGRFIGNTAGDATNSFYVPSFPVFDAFARFDFDKYRLQVNAANVLDRTYVNGCASRAQCYYGPGREILANLSVRW